MNQATLDAGPLDILRGSTEFDYIFDVLFLHLGGVALLVPLMASSMLDEFVDIDSFIIWNTALSFIFKSSIIDVIN